MPALKRRVPGTTWPLIVIAVVAGVDAALPRLTLAPLLVAAPLVAGLILTARRVALIGLLAVLIVLPLSAADHIWDTLSQAWIGAAVAAASVLGVWLARESHVRIASDQGLMARWARRQDVAMENVVARQDVAPVVIDGLYRAICGRVARPSEVAEGVWRLHGADDLAELASELRASEDGARVLLHSTVPALRTYLRSGFEARRADDPPRLVFLHFMKVGGTSLSDTLAKWFDPDRARVHMYVDELALTPPPVLAGLRLLAGHFPFHALPLIPGRFKTVAALRDPVARTVSHYSTLTGNEADFADLTLDRFVNDEAFDAVVRNYQARHLSHDVNLRGAWIDYSPEELLRDKGGSADAPNPLSALFDADRLDSDETALLARAATNLDSIDVVGTTEELDRVASVAAGLLGRPGQVSLSRLNQSKPLPPDVLTDSIRRRIEAKTEVDRELYLLAAGRSAQLRVEA